MLVANLGSYALWGVTVARKRFLLVPVCCDALSVFLYGLAGLLCQSC